MPQPQKIHFLGIGGSGLSGIAQIAKSVGFEVTGCDLSLDSPYLDKVKSLNIPILSGHSSNHLKNIDLLAVSPAVFYQNSRHPELVGAQKAGILIKWQDFMGKYLHPGNTVIAIAGTHGKSTTTALTGLLLEAAGMDPMVEVGAIVPAWDNNIRIGFNHYFVSEADEFHDNFATYYPDILLITLVEYDHPEYFNSVDNMLVHYQNLINRLKPNGTVIYNADSPLVEKLKLPKNSIPYHLHEFQPQNFPLGIAGDHNRLNALAVINLSRLLKIPDSVLTKTLSGFHGLHRRMEFLGDKKGISVYDDYANHPSSFAATINAIKENHPDSRIWAVVEPHTFSRLRVLKDQLAESFKNADQIIISQIYPSREQDPGDFTGEDIAKAIPNARFIPEFDTIVTILKKETIYGDIILVMGSGNSYRLSRQILNSL